MSVVLRSELLTRAGFAHGFSLRTGGVSVGPFASLNLGRAVGDEAQAVAENHRRLALAVGYAPERLFEQSQVHGRVVRVVRADEAPQSVRREEGDALCASDAGVTVGVRAADCLPVLLADPQTRAVAAAHSGWRGTALGVVSATVHALCALCGAPPERLIAAVFPHIRACCFEVGDEVVQQLTAASGASGASGALVAPRRSPKPHVDLAAVVRLQLTAAGLRAEQLDDVAGCTCCEPARFFSYRRDGQRSGRHLAAIVAG